MKKNTARQNIIVPGFSFSGISSGIKAGGGRDLAMIYSDLPAAAAGVFTKNRIKAAPVKLGMKQIRSRRGQAILINSGNANACTGDRGMRDAVEINKTAAGILGIDPALLYVSSTGIIGRKLPVKKIMEALPALRGRLSPLSSHEAASAIMTTDKYPKAASKKIKVGNKTGTIAGIAKGAGMICPDMATMLCFICTDISVDPALLDLALKEAVNDSFNIISVDNDMSTNDTVLVMANGVLGNRPLKKSSPETAGFKKALADLTYELASSIVRDGEGATKLIEITVNGAKNNSDAVKAAAAIADSMLVKTAIYGKDPNWGRIISAAGYSGAKVLEEKVDIFLNRTKLVSNGLGTNKEKAGAKALESRTIKIKVNLGLGKGSAKRLTSDLTEEYININARYET